MTISEDEIKKKEEKKKLGKSAEIKYNLKAHFLKFKHLRQ